MGFTSQLGTSDSQLGNIVLGLTSPTLGPVNPGFTLGPPDRRAPWFKIFVVPTPPPSDSRAISARMTAPPFTIGPDPNSPFFRNLGVRGTDPTIAGSNQVLPGFTIGPPMPGAPWFNLMAASSPTTPPPAPPTPPPITPPVLPKPGHFKPFVARDATKDSLLRPFTEKVAIILNSLLAQGLIQQTGPESFTIVGGAGGVISINGRAGTVTIQPSDLGPSGVTPGTYTSTNLTVNQYGLITSAGNGSGGGGGVTSVSVVTNQGISGTVATPTTTPAITLTVFDTTDNMFLGGGGTSATRDPIGVLGVDNIGIGAGSINNATILPALASVTDGIRNVAIGPSALANLTTGNDNFAIGIGSLYNCTTGGGNFAIGGSALFSLTTGIANFGIGPGALNAVTTGQFNIAIGPGGPLGLLQSGTNNIGLGNECLVTCITGDNNIGIGQTVLFTMDGGSSNIGIGNNTLFALTNGNSNIGIGASALASATTASNNVSVGFQCLNRLTTANKCVGIGYQVGPGLSTGDENIFIGDNAGNAITTGNSNVHIGRGAGDGDSGNNVTGSICIGYLSFVRNNYQCMIGGINAQGVPILFAGTTEPANGDFLSKHGAMYWDFTAGHPALLLKGKQSGGGVFKQRLNFSPADNYFVGGGGTTATEDTGTPLGVDNIGIGCGSIVNATTTQALAALTDGIGNIAIGPSSLPILTTGNDNIGIGLATLINLTTGGQNVAIGALNAGTAAGAGVDVGTGNVFIGQSASTTLGAIVNAVALGSTAVVHNSNQMVVGGITTDAICIGWSGSTAPANGDIDTGQAFQFWDLTPAASGLLIKGKDSGGTVFNLSLYGTNTGDQTITLTGDVTGSGTGSFAATISANAVTYAKMQAASASVLLGNPTGAGANLSEITLGVGLAFSGTTLKATGPLLVGTDRKTGLSAAQALATYTVPGADTTYMVSANVLITASTLHSFSVTCSYTDESNTARVLTLNFSQLTGAFVTTLTNALGASAYEGVPVHIRCKAGTTIIIQSTGTFTTVTYNMEERITQC